MYWKSKELAAEEKIRERIAYHQDQLYKQTLKLEKLYDKVYKENQNEKMVKSR